MMSGKLEVKKLGKVFSTLEWVDEVTVYTFKTLKGYSSDKGVLTSVDVELDDVNTMDDYNNKVALIKSYIPDVDKLQKKYDGYKMRLSIKEDNQEISFNMRIAEKEVIGAILGCKLVEVRKTYSTLTCELKAKSD